MVKWTSGGSISVFQTVNGCSCTPKSLTVTLVPPPVITGNLVACQDGTATYIASGALPAGSYTWSLSNALGTITSGQGTNTITVQWHGTTNPGNSSCILTVVTCGGSNSITVVVTTPGPVTITKSGTLCSITGMTLTSSVSGLSYQWFLNGVATGPNAQSIVITTPGTYSVIVTPASGCPSRGLIVIPPEPLPVASISANGPLSYCPAQPISTQLQALNGPNYCYQWYFNGNLIIGATTAFYTATQLGSYYCVVTFCGTQCSKTSNVLSITLGGCCNGGCGANYSISITQSGCNPVTFNATVTPNP